MTLTTFGSVSAGDVLDPAGLFDPAKLKRPGKRGRGKGSVAKAASGALPSNPRGGTGAGAGSIRTGWRGTKGR
jgi:hypothetical protein